MWRAPRWHGAGAVAMEGAGGDRASVTTFEEKHVKRETLSKGPGHGRDGADRRRQRVVPDKVRGGGGFTFSFESDMFPRREKPPPMMKV